MDVGAIRIEPEVARRAYLDYRALGAKQRTEEDNEIQASYLELSRGRAIVNARTAIEIAGFHENWLPRIAFARADWRSVLCQRLWDGSVRYLPGWHWRVGNSTNLTIRGFRPPQRVTRGTNPVPVIPPAHRPGSTPGALKRYWIAFEVEDWREPTRDPLLLRRINATTFAVIAAWDLTEVERMVLAGRGADE